MLILVIHPSSECAKGSISRIGATVSVAFSQISLKLGHRFEDFKAVLHWEMENFMILKIGVEEPFQSAGSSEVDGEIRTVTTIIKLANARYPARHSGISD
ncbi:hypothetical protein [Vacuolonema iberomarrocanum]|uniref:hypothetical protein n=1 Tax=Vacuolonema iberomarrocanum TaxID=3454632 RepID=UPI0019FBE2B3|nr:hypothetical protein [filamentous cyanobacterium LEGE 07170]